MNWIKMSDRQPEQGESCIFYLAPYVYSDYPFEGVLYDGLIAKEFTGEQFEPSEIDCWMPIPEPPGD